MSTTYQYDTGTETLEYVVDYTDEPAIVIEKNPFLVENKVVSSYSDGTTTYYPLQLITTPSVLDGKTLTATMVDAGRVTAIGAGPQGANVDLSVFVRNPIYIQTIVR